MPTLIRLIVALLSLVGLAYGGMFALTMMVDPGEEEITVKVPARDLVVAPVRVEPLPTEREAVPPPSTGTDAAPATTSEDAPE